MFRLSQAYSEPYNPRIFTTLPYSKPWQQVRRPLSERMHWERGWSPGTFRSGGILKAL